MDTFILRRDGKAPDAARPRTGAPDAPLAKEALALAKLQSGDVKGARTDLEVLSLTLGTPAGVKQRAQEVVSAIDSGGLRYRQGVAQAAPGQGAAANSRACSPECPARCRRTPPGQPQRSRKSYP